MSSENETANVIAISRAKSFVPIEDRYVDMRTLQHYFSISRSAAKNYISGGFRKDGEFRPYPQGKMPCKRLPGGGLRFKLSEVEAWFESRSE